MYYIIIVMKNTFICLFVFSLACAVELVQSFGKIIEVLLFCTMFLDGNKFKQLH